MYSRREWSPERLREARNMVATVAAPPTRLRSETARYNCVGLVFANRRAWIEDSQIRTLLVADGYKRLADASSLMEGDVVVYVDATDGRAVPVHVAVVLNKTLLGVDDAWSGVMVLSKWGLHGEYIHRMESVPIFLGRPAEYWTERNLA